MCLTPPPDTIINNVETDLQLCHPLKSGGEKKGDANSTPLPTIINNVETDTHPLKRGVQKKRGGLYPTPLPATIVNDVARDMQLRHPGKRGVQEKGRRKKRVMRVSNPSSCHCHQRCRDRHATSTPLQTRGKSKKAETSVHP